MDAALSPTDADAMLEQLAAEGARGRFHRGEGLPNTQISGSLNQTANDLKRLRYSHDAMIDELVAHPAISQNELAARFGYTPAWVSTVMATDLFQERLHQRRTQLVDPTVAASVRERFSAVVFQSLTILQEKLSRPADQVPDNLALRAVELGAKGLSLGGFGGNSAPPPATPNVDNLERLAGRLLELQGTVRRANTEDAVIVKED